MSDAPKAKPDTTRILLGQIAGVHGIKGHVLVRTYSDAPAGIAAYGPLENEGGDKTFTFKVIRETDKGIVASVNGISDRTTAEGLRGTNLYVARDKLPAPAEGEYYHADLIGLKAIDVDGQPVGTVVAVQNYGAGDLLEIKRPGSSQTALVPLTDHFVPDIDLAAKTVITIVPDFVAGEDSEAEQSSDGS